MLPENDVLNRLVLRGKNLLPVNVTLEIQTEPNPSCYSTTLRIYLIDKVNKCKYDTVTRHINMEREDFIDITMSYIRRYRHTLFLAGVI